jgi:hypothetical protein
MIRLFCKEKRNEKSKAQYKRNIVVQSIYTIKKMTIRAASTMNPAK